MKPGGLVGYVVADRFRVLRLLGEGAMGEVYVAEHVVLRQPFALKVLKAHIARDPTLAARFRQEAQVASRLEHPNIVFISDFGKMPNGMMYLVMEYIEGASLREAIDTAPGKRLSLVRSLRILRQLGLALDCAHQADVVHRDVKPDNVLLAKRADGEDLVKVLDFGLAKMLHGGEVLTKAGELFGSPMYMSPEQCRGDLVDPGADLYSMGIIAYELLTGRPPFDFKTIPQMLMAHLQDPVPAMASILPSGEEPLPAQLEELVMRCLAKERADRPASAAEVVAAIDAYLEANRDAIDELANLRAPPSAPVATVAAQAPRVSQSLPPPPAMLVAGADQAALRQWYWNQACKLAEYLARWLEKRHKASPELRQAMQDLTRSQEAGLMLQTDLALAVSGLEDLEERYREPIAQIRHAVVDLRVERETAAEQEGAGSERLRDVDYQVQTLESRLAEVYGDWTREAETFRGQVSPLRADVDHQQQEQTDYERRLIGLVRWEKPQPCPPGTARKYTELEAIVAHLFGS